MILEILHGEGGDDSKNFVDELFAAYLKYSSGLSLKCELLHSDYGHVVAKVSGKGAGNAFKNEPGKHCVQRIPETEAKGRKQTSIVVVGVLPIRSDTGSEPLKDADLDVTTQRGHGKGGQHQNKTDSAVRMRHIPTGLSVFINGRDQHSNKREALKILTAKVHEVRLAEVDGEYAEIRKAQMGDSGRSNKVRTYNLLESRVVDHRLGTKTGNVKAVMKGEFQLLFKTE